MNGDDHCTRCGHVILHRAETRPTGCAYCVGQPDGVPHGTGQ